MVSKLILKERLILADDLFAEMVVWQVEPPVRGSLHVYKYRLALVEPGSCVLRYDNEAGKGDHRHGPEGETAITFTDVESLVDAFFAEVQRWSAKR